jgi:hypothetical protein
MKKALFSFAIGTLLLVVPRAAKSDDVSVDFFYNNLSGGSWIEVGDYGYCWQPDVAVGNSNWRPYADGYWAYTDLGWTWVSYEDFGWATYHYGRWAMVDDYGWVWVPGRDAELEWGPAWVSWRTGGEYIGWAPLPPDTIAVVESRPLTGHLDVEFNIGPAYYNFVDVRYIGEPVLRGRIIAPSQNVTYIEQTVNVTNITYRNNTVYNYGPDINVVNRRAARPIQKLRLDREQNVDVAAAARTGGLTKVQGDRLVVAAPARITRPARQVAPQHVKATVAAPKVDHGWSAVGDEHAQAEFKQRIRNQDLKNAPSVTGPGPIRRTNTAGPGGANADTAAQNQPAAERDRSRGQQTAGGSASPGSSPVQGTTVESREARDRGAGNQRNRFPQSADHNPPANTGSAAESAATQNENADQQAERQRQNANRRGQMQNAPTPARGIDSTVAPSASTAAGGVDASQANGADEHRNRRSEMQGDRAERNGQPARPDDVQGRQGRRLQNQPAEAAPGDLQGQAGGGPRRQRETQPAGREQGQAQQEGQGHGRDQRQGDGQQGGRRRQGEGSPAPTPQ